MYAKVSSKLHETQYWLDICIDLVCPYMPEINELHRNGFIITLLLAAMKFVDPSTSWFEIIQVLDNNKSSVRVFLCNCTWLC